MMAVAVGNAAHKSGDNHLRPFAPDGQHCVVEHAFVAPFDKGFFLRFRKSEVHLRTPELLRAVILVCL